MNNQGKLTLRFDDDSDGTGKLLADASANGFAGKGGAYFSIPHIEEFADSLVAFPLPETNFPEIAGGFGKRDAPNELAQEHLSIAVYPVDGRGHLGIQIRIATELWDGEREKSQHAVKLEFLTGYEAIAKFSKNLKALVVGQIEEAILESELL